MTKILVVEDDPAVRVSLERSLEFEGYDVVSAIDGRAAIDAVDAHEPDVVVLDLGLPRLDGLEVCRRLRAAGRHLPILMLTARESTGDRVRGLDAGADDYLPKPFALEELLARLRALVRRTGVAASAGQVLVVEDLRMDLATREVTRGGTAISLTPTEFRLLELLMTYPRQVLPRSRILSQVWGYDSEGGSNALEVYVGYLRRKTEETGGGRLVQTVRGIGYTIRPAS